MVNASSCTTELWMHSGDVLAGLQSSQQLKENHQLAQWEYVARSRFWIWLGEFSSYVLTQDDVWDREEPSDAINGAL